MNNKIVDLIRVFIEIYASLITKYDSDHKDIYLTRFEDSFKKAVSTVNGIAEYKRKMKVTGGK